MNSNPDSSAVCPSSHPESRHPFIKICGVRTIADAVHAARAGADLIGINLWPRSPRFVDDGLAAELCAALRREATPPKIVLVVVMPDVATISGRVADMNPDYVQVHGVWGDEVQIGGVPVIRGFAVGDAADIDEVMAWPGDLVLVDARVTGQHGGTGRAVPGDLLERVLRPMLLAGGLTPDNVGAAARRFRPWGVDVASGVESSPGVKDPRAVEDFIRAARTA